MTYGAKVFDAVIGSVAVLMVNHVGRPFAMNPKPRQPMRQVFATIYEYPHIALLIKGACDHAPVRVAMTRHVPPDKLAGMRAVSQQLAKSLGRQSFDASIHVEQCCLWELQSASEKIGLAENCLHGQRIEMTPKQYKSHRERLRLSHAGLAERLGIGRVTSWKYENERLEIPIFIGLAVASLKVKKK